jgi:predicted Zn-dependent protease
MVPVKQKHRLLKRLLLAILVAGVSISAVAQSGRVNLPELGNSASDVLSASEEQEYAEGLIRQMRAYELLIEDPLINGFFSDMGYNLASHSDQPEAAFNFVVLDQPVVNAFAAPGGVIGSYHPTPYVPCLRKRQDHERDRHACDAGPDPGQWR